MQLWSSDGIWKTVIIVHSHMRHVSNIWTACMPTLNFVIWLNHAGVVRDFLQIHNRISTVWPCIDLMINGYTMTTGLFKKRGCGIVIRLEFQVIMCAGIQTSHCLLHVFFTHFLAVSFEPLFGLQRSSEEKFIHECRPHRLNVDLWTFVRSWWVGLAPLVGE